MYARLFRIVGVALIILGVFTAVLVAAPRFTNATVRSGGIVLSGSGGGSNGAFTLFVSTNPALPFTNWTLVKTNSFDGIGHFNSTNSFSSKTARQFFVMQTLPLDSLWVPTCGAWLGAAVTNGTTANFSAHEARIGHELDVLRIYHTPGSWTNLTSTEKTYIQAGRKLLLSVKPNSFWSNCVGMANGGSAAVDAQMTSLAKSIAGMKPNKVMLIVWHEPENDVIGSMPSAKAGTTTQYIQMWHNVRGIFDANNATNVIWVWDVQDYAPLRYLTPALWPGNSYVDWVMWDEYQDASSETFSNVLQTGYTWMTTNSSSSNNYLSKPWGLAEWGVGINSYIPTVADQTNGINGLNAALNKYNAFPRLKLIEYYDDLASELQPGSVAAYSNFANSPYLNQQCLP